MRINDFKIRFLFMALVLVVVGMACQKNNGGVPGEMTFRVNDALLGDPIVLDSLGFRLRPPMGWETLPSDLLQSLNDQMQGNQSERQFRFHPIQFNMNQKEESLLSISLVEFTLDANRIDFNTAYRMSLAQKFPKADIKQTLFYKDGIEFNQIFITAMGRTMIKLLVRNAKGQLLQLDYMVPTPLYSKLVESIESSIGSIQKIESN